MLARLLTQAAARPQCGGTNVAASVHMTATGDHGSYWDERDYRLGVHHVTAATLWVHGFADLEVQPGVTVGFWERLPRSTPHKLILGQWGHGEAFRGKKGRADANEIERAWFDRWLMGLDTGVEAWPDVQVQEPDGQWRAEESWPSVGGDPGQLPLAPTTAAPTVVVEGAPGPQPRLPGPASSFPTRPSVPTDVEFRVPVSDVPLHLTGMPVLDLWVVPDRPDVNLMARVDVVDPEGRPVPGPPVYGGRSLMHLEPMTDDYFRQPSGKLAEVGAPVRVPIRLQPTDLVVAPGNQLRVRVFGAGANDPPAVPSGLQTVVRILHDCTHQSMLRFEMPEETPSFLTVTGTDTGSGARGVREVDGGVARLPSCGRDPVDPLTVTRGVDTSGWAQ